MALAPMAGFAAVTVRALPFAARCDDDGTAGVFAGRRRPIDQPVKLLFRACLDAADVVQLLGILVRKYQPADRRGQPFTVPGIGWGKDAPLFLALQVNGCISAAHGVQ